MGNLSSYYKSCTVSFQSDLYSVGLIMYELYQPFYTEMEKCGSLRQIRDKQVLSQEFTAAWPVQVSSQQLNLAVLPVITWVSTLPLSGGKSRFSSVIPPLYVVCNVEH